VCLLFALWGPVPAALGPTETVRQTVDAVINVLENEALEREAKWRQIGAIVSERFDYRSMSQSVLATNWQQATPEEKRQFIEYFSQYLEQVYRDKIELYTNQRVDYLQESSNGDRAVVDTVIVTDSTQIPVTYRLKNNDGEWFAYDVIIENVSLVSNYRSTFAAILDSQGVDGLLQDLESKIASYKRERGIGE
jgi:phospholipid transport system substrate-binding protein